MAGNFFRGTSVEQDGRWGKSDVLLMAKMTKAGKFAAILDTKVNLKKVNLDVMSKWVNEKIVELVGFEDEILINLVVNMLQSGELEGKKLQLDVTGFLEKQAGAFVEELWTYLVDAQTQPNGIPSAFIQKKKQEILSRQESVVKKILATDTLGKWGVPVNEMPPSESKDTPNIATNDTKIEGRAKNAHRRDSSGSRSRERRPQRGYPPEREGRFDRDRHYEESRQRGFGRPNIDADYYRPPPEYRDRAGGDLRDRPSRNEGRGRASERDRYSDRGVDRYRDRDRGRRDYDSRSPERHRYQGRDDREDRRGRDRHSESRERDRKRRGSERGRDGSRSPRRRERSSSSSSSSSSSEPDRRKKFCNSADSPVHDRDNPNDKSRERKGDKEKDEEKDRGKERRSERSDEKAGKEKKAKKHKHAKDKEADKEKGKHKNKDKDKEKEKAKEKGKDKDTRRELEERNEMGKAEEG